MSKNYYVTCKKSLDTYLGEGLPSETHENLTIDAANKLFDECREWAMFCRMGTMDEGSIVRDWVYNAEPDFNIRANEPYREDEKFRKLPIDRNKIYEKIKELETLRDLEIYNHKKIEITHKIDELYEKLEE